MYHLIPILYVLLVIALDIRHFRVCKGVKILDLLEEQVHLAFLNMQKEN